MIRVIIADDEQIERATLRLILNKGIERTLEIFETGNGRETIAMAWERDPEIIFMDIKMPGINGLEAAREIRKNHPDTFFVFITAYNEFEFAHEAIKIGVEDFLIKPVAERNVIELTSKIIHKVETVREQRIRHRNTNVQLDVISEYFQNEFLFHLFIRGMSNDKFLEYLSVLGFRFLCGQGAVLQLDYDSYPIPVESAYQRKILARRCGTMVTGFFKNHGVTCLFNFELSTPFFLMFLQDDAGTSEEGIDSPRRLSILDASTIDSLHADLETQLNIRALVKAGPVFYEAEDAARSYSRAVSSLDSNNLSDESGQGLPPGDLPLQLADRLKQALLTDDTKAYRNAKLELESWINSYCRHPELMQERLGELFAVLRHFLHTRQIEVGEIPESPVIRKTDPIEEIQAAVGQFLHLLSGYSSQESPAMALSPAIRHIRKHFTRDLSLSDLAEICRFSPTYFSRLFKKAMGVSFVDYLNGLRIERAQQLLENPDLGIAEISEQCGFRDANYFTRVFRKLVKISPRDYRRQLWAKQDSDGTA